MSSRGGMKPVYIGDVGEIFTTPARRAIPSDEEIDAMSDHDLFAVALECGVSLYDIIGINHCYEHIDMVFLGSNSMPSGYNLLDHTNWCRNCFQLFRLARI